MSPEASAKRESLSLSYFTTQAGAMSFDSDKVRGYISQFLEPTDRVLNLCAGDTPLPIGDVDRNDIRPEVDSEYTEDVRDLFGIVDNRYNVVIYDPPFSLHQHTETYDLDPELWPGYGEHIATGIESLLKPDGRAIQLGFHGTIDPTGATALEPTNIAVFQQLGRGYDWCATVAEKAESGPTETPVSSTGRRELVTPNPSENSGAAPSFNMRYKRTKTNNLESRIADEILRELGSPPGGGGGKTLALIWGEQPAAFECNTESRDGAIEDIIVPYSGPADRLIACPLGHGDSIDGIEIHPEEISAEVPQLDYDNIVIWPPLKAYNWNIEYQGESCGYVRGLKRTLDKILGGGTTIYTVGRTMTGMRNAWDYEHQGVTILDHVTEQASWYISRFEKPQSGLGETSEPNTPIDMDYRASETRPNWVTMDSLTSWYYHPALYMPCTECGAHQNNHCVDDGEVVPMHQERIDWFQQSYIQNDGVRWYRGRGFGKVETTPSHDWSGTATPSSTTNTEDREPDDPTTHEDTTEATNISQFVSG